MQQLRRFDPFRRGDAGTAVALPSDPSAAIDLGDLAVAQLVHDLRNQLTAVTYCAENIAAQVPGGQADEAVAEMHRCVERASSLARELLTAARPTFVARRPVDLNDVIGAAVKTFSVIAGERIRLRIRLSTERLPVVADPIEIERIFLNLALNARDAMEDDGVLTIETASVRDPFTSAEGLRVGPAARLTISDTGVGLTPEIRKRMFEPFFTTKKTGTGLGLSSVIFTVRQLRGTLAVKSEPGRGTSIEVLLPLVANGYP